MLEYVGALNEILKHAYALCGILKYVGALSERNIETCERLGRYHTQSKCPHGMSGGSLLTENLDTLILLAELTWIGSDWIGPRVEVFRTLPQPQLRVFTSNDF